MVKIPQITTSNDEVSLSRHPRCQCKTLWPRVKWMPVNFHSNIHIRVITIFSSVASHQKLCVRITSGPSYLLNTGLDFWTICKACHDFHHKRFVTCQEIHICGGGGGQNGIHRKDGY